MMRPVYHHLQRRTEAHICIAFAAYIIWALMRGVPVTKSGNNAKVQLVKKMPGKELPGIKPSNCLD